MLGGRRGPAVAPAGDHGDRAPLAVLETLLLPALERRPCLVAFSGGRDSSTVLAVATAVARREGLDDPVPTTFRYDGHPRTQEDEWQEAMLRHLAIGDRVVLSYDDEADALGTIASGLLARVGHYWPSGAHVVMPLLEAAAGGSLLTGVGGDELFSPWEHRRLALLRAGRLRPGGDDLRRLALALSPPPVRRALWRRRAPVQIPWLTPAGNRGLAAAYADHVDRFLRRSWARSAEDYLDSRYLEVMQGSLAALAATADVALVEPFMDPAMVRAVVSRAPREGFASREEALGAHFGDLVPAETLGRSTKAVFTEVFWGPASRAFAEEWDGTGLDPALVDVAALRAQWRAPRPDFRSVSALHAAWMAGRESALTHTSGPADGR
jgi:asparagine synthase (glutamine-hydrolysing)